MSSKSRSLPRRMLPLLLLQVWMSVALASDAERLEALWKKQEAHAYDEIISEARALLEASEDNPAFAADVLDLMVDTLRRAGRGADPEGREMGERAVRLRIETAGPGDPSVADSETLLGALLSHAGELDAAVAAHRRALAIYEKALGSSDEKVAVSLDHLADVLQKQAVYGEALASYTRALAIQEKVHGSDSLRTAEVLYDMGNLAIRTGDYSAARRRHERVLEIYQARYDAGHSEISRAKIVLGYLLNLTGDLPRARKVLEEAAEELGKSVGADHPLTAAAWTNLGTVLFAMEDFDTARIIFGRVLASREKSRGPDHPETADALLNLGAALRELGRNEEALPLYRRAMDIYLKKLGADHPRVAQLTLNLANASLEAGRTREAVAMYRRALEIRVNTLGRNHPDTARSHEVLAGALLLAGDRAGALEQAVEAARILDRHTRETVSFLPERQALMMRTRRENPEAVLFQGLSEGDGGDGESWLRACWEWTLQSRALVPDELARRTRTVLTAEKGAARRAWEDLAAARQAIAHLWVKGPNEYEGDFDEALDRARARKEDLELKLARLSSEYGRERLARTAGLDEIRAELGHSSALLEYVKVEKGLPTDRQRPEHYFALVLPGNGAPRVAELGPAGEIDQRVAAWREALESSGRAIAMGAREEGVLEAATADGRRLREAIWDPAAALLDDVTSVFVVPDGRLHNVDFHALPARGGGYLIEEDPAMHLLDAARDLVRLASSESGGRAGGRDALVVGAPEFGAPSAAPDQGDERGGNAACDPRLGERWPELHESAREVQVVGRLLGVDGPATVLTGKEAGEAHFKAEAPGKGILHLATHGFFLYGRCQEDEAAMNPLLLSGLVLAGANSKTLQTAEDGYLTSEELAALDLRGLDLVVLSACDTGRGHIESGEGVLGLRRSLALAGARTVVMSLWRVPDRESRRWMTSFYEARAGGASVREAVRHAGLSSLQRLRRRKIPPHPTLWAGFVAAGDWR